MVRRLRFHEKKLLKKVDFISWEVDNNLHEVKILKKYYIQKREDYTKYNKLSRHVRELARKVKELDVKDPFRAEATSQLLEKLYNMGLVETKRGLELADNVNASSFCRRRLPVMMVKNHMAQTLKAATRINILASHISQNIKHEIVFLWHPCLTWYRYVHHLKKVKFLKMKSIY